MGVRPCADRLQHMLSTVGPARGDEPRVDVTRPKEEPTTRTEASSGVFEIPFGIRELPRGEMVRFYPVWGELLTAEG